MAQVAIEKSDGKKSASGSISNDLDALTERVRQRAFELFQRRGGIDGFDLDDWFAAEQDLLQIPQSELIEKDGTFQVRLSAAGFEVEDVKVIAQPDALIVKASASHRQDKSEENVYFSEFDRKTLYRRFDVPQPIAVDRVTANLANGVLQVLAPRAKPEAVKAKAEVKLKTQAAA